MPNFEKMQDMIESSVTLKRRFTGVAFTANPKDSGHASTGGSADSGLRVNVNSTWSSGQTDKRVRATLYHESVHLDQRRNKTFMESSTKAVREFHAHTEELRKAMKHNLYTEKDYTSKLKKINKYYSKAEAEGNISPMMTAAHQKANARQRPDRISTRHLLTDLQKARGK